MLSNVVRAALGNEETITASQIRDRVRDFRKLPGFDVTDEEAERLCKDIESSLDITMAIGSVVQEEFVEWLGARKAEISPYYWERYRQYLEQKNFPRRVITRLDGVTDRILGLLENPKKPGPWDRRGMVVGHVQSGKTANYTGLICKAADAGYRLIVVIAGIHNNLRNQTQARIDEGFVGRDSATLLSNKTQKLIGVGKFGASEFPLTVTNTKQDFNKNTATTLGVQLRALSVPAVLVIKKNASTLKHLNEWLRTHNTQGPSSLVDAPMLLIDDEADNASIDISRDPDKSSTINARIRELLRMFNRSCYVGYTATPFANIFIDPDNEQEMLGEDLFPRDFIISLEAPSNYFGAARVFGSDDDPAVVRDIDDNELLLPIKHKNFHKLPALPESLYEAVRSFVLARAIRILRGQAKAHNSMLVNASRFTSVQGEMRDLLHEFVLTLVRRIRFETSGDPEIARSDSMISALHATWKREFSGSGHAWSEIFHVLLDAVAPISVIEVNSKSTGALDYESFSDTGRHVIAVGGFSLSRGLTLEGLTTSYFLRNSIMYDTLMQMGRWFGYRHGYDDLCRIWMTPDASGWYEHVSESIEELRTDLRTMEQARLTPRDFGLKVRSHPDNLIVTARNKMGTAESFSVRIGLSNQFIETYALPAKNVRLDKNMESAKKLIEAISNEAGVEENREKGSVVWRNVPAIRIKEFLTSWDNQQESLQTDPAPVVDYIERRNPSELAEWDVVLVGLGGAHTELDDRLGREVRCQERTVSKTSTSDCIYVSTKNRVASRGAEQTGLAADELKAAREWWETEATQSGKNPENIPDRAYRRQRSRPLLLIHLLKLRAPTSGDQMPFVLPQVPVVAWGISFPTSNHDDPTVEYVVNTTWMREAFSDELDEEGEEKDEDTA